MFIVSSSKVQFEKKTCLGCHHTPASVSSDQSHRPRVEATPVGLGDCQASPWQLDYSQYFTLWGWHCVDMNEALKVGWYTEYVLRGGIMFKNKKLMFQAIVSRTRANQNHHHCWWVVNIEVGVELNELYFYLPLFWHVEKDICVYDVYISVVCNAMLTVSGSWHIKKDKNGKKAHIKCQGVTIKTFFSGRKRRTIIQFHTQCSGGFELVHM